MTYQQFYDECLYIRENRLKADSIRKQLDSLEAEKFERMNAGTVSDPGRDKVQRVLTKDNSYIATMDLFDRKRKALLKNLEELPKYENEDIKALIIEDPSTGGYISTCYILFGQNFNEIAEKLEASKSNCYVLFKKNIEALYTKYQERTGDRQL